MMYLWIVWFYYLMKYWHNLWEGSWNPISQPHWRMPWIWQEICRMCCQEPNTPPSQISLPSSNKVRNHGKRNPLQNKIKEDQGNNNLEERSYVSHANNLGFWDIDVPMERRTTLNFYLKMMKRGRRRKHNLQPKKRAMKQQKKNNPLLR